MSLKALLVVLLIAVALSTSEPNNVQPPVQESVTVPQPDDEDGNVYTPDEEPIEIKEREPEPEVSETLSAPKVEEVVDVAPTASAPTSYLYESLLISLILMCLMNYKTGKRTNEVIADRWVRSVMNLVQDNFALIGFGDQPNQSDQAVILEESAHEYTFYASGRENLEFLEATFELRRREDLLSYYGLELVFPEKDLVTIDIPMSCSNSVVFCLAKKKQLKTLKEKCSDLSYLTKDFGVAGLNEAFRILGQNTESVDFVFDGYVIKNLNQLSSVIYSIHYTDQKMFSRSPGHLKLVLNANSNEPEKNEQALKLALYIVDKITALKLPQNIKAKCDKAREAFAATKEKEELEKKLEEIQKQKAEKRRKEQQRIKHLPPEKQRKALDALRNKQMSKRLRGRVMKVM